MYLDTCSRTILKLSKPAVLGRLGGQDGEYSKYSSMVVVKS